MEQIILTYEEDILCPAENPSSVNFQNIAQLLTPD
jgi:hypothetical protein